MYIFKCLAITKKFFCFLVICKLNTLFSFYFANFSVSAFQCEGIDVHLSKHLALNQAAQTRPLLVRMFPSYLSVCRHVP